MAGIKDGAGRKSIVAELFQAAAGLVKIVLFFFGLCGFLLGWAARLLNILRLAGEAVTKTAAQQKTADKSRNM